MLCLRCAPQNTAAIVDPAQFIGAATSLSLASCQPFEHVEELAREVALELCNLKMRIDKDDWVVVCDGRKALIPENLGDEMLPNIRTREVHEQPNPSTGAQGTDAPDRLMARPPARGARWSGLIGTTRRSALPARPGGTARCRRQLSETSALTMITSPQPLGMIRAQY